MHPLLIVAICVLGFALLSFLSFIILSMPKKSRPEEKWYLSHKFAHRGLHGDGAAENSLTAFRRAVEAGYGIELDVRLSKDGELMVFHDDTLDRVTDATGRVDAKTKEELSEIRLLGTEDTVPTFRQVLDLVNGKVPLLVEIKEDAMKTAVSEKTCEMLAEYKGDFVIESFNPLALGIVKKRLPRAIRGLLSQNYLKQKKYRKLMYFLLHHFLLNIAAKPMFIAFSHKDAKHSTFRFLKGLYKVPTLAWTVKSKEDEERAKKNGFDTVIFEGYKA